MLFSHTCTRVYCLYDSCNFGRINDDVHVQYIPFSMVLQIKTLNVKQRTNHIHDAYNDIMKHCQFYNSSFPVLYCKQ